MGININHLKSSPMSLVDLTEVKSIDLNFSQNLCFTALNCTGHRIMGGFYHIASIEKLIICHKTNLSGNKHKKWKLGYLQQLANVKQHFLHLLPRKFCYEK